MLDSNAIVADAEVVHCFMHSPTQSMERCRREHVCWRMDVHSPSNVESQTLVTGSNVPPLFDVLDIEQSSQLLEVVVCSLRGQHRDTCRRCQD